MEGPGAWTLRVEERLAKVMVISACASLKPESQPSGGGGQAVVPNVFERASLATSAAHDSFEFNL